jgi:hypothetical protein
VSFSGSFDPDMHYSFICSSSSMWVLRPTHLVRYCRQICLLFASLSFAVFIPLLCGCEQALHKPTTLTQIRERSTQTRNNFIDRQLTPTKYLDTEEPRTPWNKCTAVRSLLVCGELVRRCVVTRFV